MELHFAPLQGHADIEYLRRHSEVYGPVDACYTPFIRIEKGVPRRQDMARLGKACGFEVVPQLIFNSLGEFSTIANALKANGHRRIDVNLGCPYPMQTGRGRGSAMIANANAMEQVAEYIASDNEVEYSVKMRLGLRNPDEWTILMPILNRLRLKHVTVHPRISAQMYGGELYMDEFNKIIEQSINPVIYNGDLLTPEDIDRIANAYPGLKGVMIGRGFLARPSLGAEWKEGREWSRSERMSALLDFHDALLSDYEEILCGDAQILQKIKPFWEYLEPEIGHKAFKAIKKSTSLAKYRSIFKANGFSD